MIGESPTRPLIFHESPLVVVIPDTSPLASTASTFTVPYVNGASSRLPAAPTSSSPRRWSGGPQSSRSLCSSRQRRKISRVRSVIRSCSWNPNDLANSSAAGPTSSTWSVRSMTRRATDAGWMMFSSDATAPALYVLPSMNEASSWITPCSLGRPPYPTDASSGSSSMMLAARSTASVAVPPADRISHAASMARRPVSLVWLVTMMGPLACIRTAAESRPGTSPAAHAPSPAAAPRLKKSRLVMSSSMVQPPLESSVRRRPVAAVPGSLSGNLRLRWAGRKGQPVRTAGARTRKAA